jgi:hypothetical protein
MCYFYVVMFLSVQILFYMQSETNANSVSHVE